jgi:hypothetical protein
LMTDWPELYSEKMASAQVIQMYRRASDEAITVLSRYAGVVHMVQ